MVLQGEESCQKANWAAAMSKASLCRVGWAKWPLWWAQPPGAAVSGAHVARGVDAHVQGTVNPMCFEKRDRHIGYLAHFLDHWVSRVHGRKQLPQLSPVWSCRTGTLSKRGERFDWQLGSFGSPWRGLF